MMEEPTVAYYNNHKIELKKGGGCSFNGIFFPTVEMTKEFIDSRFGKPDLTIREISQQELDDALKPVTFTVDFDPPQPARFSVPLPKGVISDKAEPNPERELVELLTSNASHWIIHSKYPGMMMHSYSPGMFYFCSIFSVHIKDPALRNRLLNWLDSTCKQKMVDSITKKIKQVES